MSNSEKGFTHQLAVLVLGIGVLGLVASFVPVTRHYNDGKSAVEAVTSSASNSAKPDFTIQKDSSQTAIVNQRVGALSNFPLTVGSNNELTVTTPAGVKTVTVLPQKAVDNMLASHVMDDITSEPAEGSLGSVPSLVKLETKNGVLGYTINGTKTHKLLGLFPIKTSVEVFVSAENGQVVETNESFLAKILDKIAP